MDIISEPILGSPLLEWFATYGYWVIIPLMIIEGPIVTIISGVLASLGVFNPFTMFLLAFGSDLVSDTYFYLFGRYGLDFLERFRFTRKIAHRVKVLQQKTTGISGFFIKHPAKAVFTVKALPGTTGPGEVLAGALKVDIRRFYLGAFIGGIVWSAGLIALGYFFGSTFKNLGDAIGFIVGSVTFILIVVIIYNIYIKHEIMERTRLGNIFEKGNGRQD